MNPSPTSKQWALLRRMRANGCPIDYRNLAMPSHPLAVVNHPLALQDGGASNLFRGGGHVWIVLRLDISVTSTIGIGDLRLRAHWFAGEAALVKPCPEHPESYCLPLNPGGQHWSFSSDQVLNRWNRTKGILPRRAHCKGYILARGADFLATSRAEYLDIEICIDDWLGNEMVFPVSLVNRPATG